MRALFWGLGADGTVSANKNSIKIIGEETPNYAQGYFVYDSKKSGAMTVSHLRFGSEPIKSTYLIQRANFIAVHQFNFLERYQILEAAEEGATLLLNSPYDAEEVWQHLPRTVQQTIIEKKIKVHSINAYAVAKANQHGNRTNTIMQTCFFAISGVLPRDEAIVKIRNQSRRPTENVVNPWCGRISPRSMRRSNTARDSDTRPSLDYRGTKSSPGFTPTHLNRNPRVRPAMSPWKSRERSWRSATGQLPSG